MSNTLKPVLANIILLAKMPNKFHVRLLMPNINYKTICNHIHDLLPFNNLQQLVVKEIMDPIIKNKTKMYFDMN